MYQYRVQEYFSNQTTNILNGGRLLNHMSYKKIITASLSGI